METIMVTGGVANIVTWLRSCASAAVLYRANRWPRVSTPGYPRPAGFSRPSLLDTGAWRRAPASRHVEPAVSDVAVVHRMGLSRTR
jgi:hypothetical protein